ncbi:MAG: protein translocase subunit SecF, partial [Methanosphaera sp.]|nr:protein translocase subunit SecF [Methanosphaera sp.]
VPVILMIISLLYLGIFGLEEGVDLEGGTLVTVELKESMSDTEITELIQDTLGITDVETSVSGNSATITLPGTISQDDFTNQFSDQFNVLSFKSVGALLSDAAMTQIIYALAFALVFMAITVYIAFRDFYPSLAIILSAVCNISIATGAMSLLGISLSVASVGALLMLIGYGVDTDILLTTRLLKRHDGTLEERIDNAFSTGTTLTICALASMIVLYVVVTILIPSAQVLLDISAVLIIGLLSDLLSTWLMNLGILKWHINRDGSY